MAIKIGKQAKEGSFSSYKGIGSFNVVAVNPNKEQLEKLLDRDINEEPVYTPTSDEGQRQVRIMVYLKTDPTSAINNGIELITPISFFLTEAPRVGKESGKTQIIDLYGRTAWASPSELAAKAIPMYANGPANLSTNYRPIYQGEEQFIQFLIQWLNIAQPASYNTKTKQWTDKADLSDSEVNIDFKTLFNGNVSELTSLVELAKPYAVKVAVGIRTVTNDKGTRQYQQIYNNMFLKNSVTDFSRIDKSIKDDKDQGRYPDTEFSSLPLHMDVVEATEFDALGNDAAPADNPW